MPPCLKRIQPMSNVPLACVSVCQRMSDIFHTLAYASTIRYSVTGRDGSKSFFASPSQVTSHFLASPSQVTSHFLASPSQVTSHLVRRQVKSQVIWSDVKSSHKSFGPNTSQVTSLFVQVQVKSHIILSSCNTQSGPVIKSIYSELQSKIYEMVNGIK